MILVVLDNDGKTLRKGALEALSRAFTLKEAFGSVVGLVMGENPELAAGEATRYLDKVLSAQVGKYTAEAYAEVVVKAAQAVEAEVVVATASRTGRSWTPRVAVQLDAALLEDTLASRPQDGKLVVERYSFLNRVTETQAAETPVVLTVKPNTTEVAQPGEGGSVEVLEQTPEEGGLEVLELIQEQAGRVALTEADIVITGGRGMGGAEAFDQVEELADLLKGAVGSTRAVVDAGWRPYAEQVGQTGKTVQPSVYFALGVSGAVQHQSGMNKSKLIVAVNKDPDAPIFKISDYGIVGDVRKVLPAMIETVKKLKN